MRDRIERIAIKVTQDVFNSIDSCNRPDMSGYNKFFEPLVFISQDACDKILAKTEISVLERIIESAKVVESYRAGNCLLQVFVAFRKLLREFIQQGQTDVHSCISLRIATTKNHAVLIVAEKLVCDPWVNRVEWISDSDYRNKNVGTYFAIRSDWSCYSDEEPEDNFSKEFAIQLLAPSNVYSAASIESHNEGAVSSQTNCFV